MKDIDRRLAALGDRAPTPDLTGLESAVWTAIDAGDHRRASVGVALAFYILAAVTVSGAGAAMATASSRHAPPSVFAIHPAGALSTILGG